MEDKLQDYLKDAECKAWGALAEGKFVSFGHWASVWSTLNNMAEDRHPNPWSKFIRQAKEVRF